MRRVAVVVCGLMAAASGQAGLIYNIYNNFGAGDSFVAGSGVVVPGLRPSFAFSTGSALLVEVDFVTSVATADDLNEVTITLSDDAFGHPGTALASMTFDGQMGIGNSEINPPHILSWIPAVEPGLAAGAQYWITFDGPQGSNIIWNTNDTGAFGDSVFSNGQWVQTQATIGALRIVDDPTPEPASWLLLGAGCISLVPLARRRRRLVPATLQKVVARFPRYRSPAVAAP